MVGGIGSVGDFSVTALGKFQAESAASDGPYQ